MGQSNSTQGRGRKSTKVSSFGGNLNLEVRTQAKDLANYKVKSPPLGRGPFGEIREAFHTVLKEKFLMKVIFKQQFSETELKDIQSEYNLLKELAHPNIIGVKEFFDEDRFFYIIQYYFKGRPLFDKVRETGGVKETQVSAKILGQLAKTLDFVNGKGIIYRNLKLENILYNGRQIRLYDFSQAAHLEAKQKLSDLSGSIHFSAPEMIKGAYDTRADIWAFGVLMYVLIYGAYPFDGKDEANIMEAILNQQPDYSSVEPVANSAIDLIKMILQKKPENRPTWSEIHAHNFFTIGKDKETDSVKRMFAKVRGPLLSFGIESTFHLAIYLYFMRTFFANIEGSNVVEELFAKIDVRSKGKVTYPDFKKFNDEYGVGMSDADIKSILGKLDKDNSGTVEYEEFLAGCINREKLLTDEKIDAFFASLANQHPDYVSLEDLQLKFTSQPKEVLINFMTHWGVPQGEAFTKDIFRKMMVALRT